MIGESDYTNVFSCGHIYDRDNFGLLDIRRQITVLCEARKRDWVSAVRGEKVVRSILELVRLH